MLMVALPALATDVADDADGLAPSAGFCAICGPLVAGLAPDSLAISSGSSFVKSAFGSASGWPDLRGACAADHGWSCTEPDSPSMRQVSSAAVGRYGAM